MTRGWGREDQPDAAVGKILDAADKAFVELGVSAVGMAEIARFAGCSRGTLYRYFKNRNELHRAYVERAALAIQSHVRERVESIEDPRRRLVEFIVCSVAEVRDNPATAAWFAPGASGLAARLSHSAELVESLTSSFVPEKVGTTGKRADHALRRRWLVRIVVSLLADPGQTRAEERTIVERFVVPALFEDPEP